MAISSAGLGSGLPINDLVSQLVAAEGAPVQNRLDRREALIQTELSAIGLLKGALSNFQSKLSGLMNADSFINRRSSSSDSSIASLSADQTAALGSYSLEVTNLATAHNLVAKNGYSDASEGDLTFTNQAGDTFTVEIGPDETTLEKIAVAINDDSENFGVTAKIINVSGEGRLVLTADETGVDNLITSITATGTGDIQNFGYDYAAAVDGDDANWDQTVEALDASFSLEGQSMTSASNVLEDLIPDTTITLKDVTELGSPITLKVDTSTSSVRKMIEEFVTAYNELSNLITQQTAYDAESGRAGALQGDALARSIQGQLRSFVSGDGSAFGSLTAIVNLGVSTDRNGLLKIDSSQLNDALSNSFDDIAGFFSYETTGLANRVDAMLDNYLESTGTFASRSESLNARLDRIDTDREQLVTRMEKLEARYLAQFTAMDALVANLQSTGNFLTQQLDSIAKIQTSRYK